MKCTSCNAPLSIDDERCPYCGTPNPHALGHRKDMQKFTREFIHTRSSVLNTTYRAAEKSVRIIILCFLTILLILSILFSVNSWEVSYGITKLTATANSGRYCDLLDQYEAEGDFLSFASLYDQKSLYSIDAFEEYRYVYQAASNYMNIFDCAVSLLEKEPWENAHKDNLKYLCDALEYHDQLLERDLYDYYSEIGVYDSRHLESVDRITEKINGILQLVFSVSEEEMTEFQTYSSAEKQVFLQRRFRENE